MGEVGVFGVDGGEGDGERDCVGESEGRRRFFWMVVRFLVGRVS